MRRLPKVDVAICGLGWAGSILLAELGATGLKVAGLERGERVSLAPGVPAGALEQDDLRGQRGETAQNLSRERLTFRHGPQDTAFPIRRRGSFLVGEAVGGGGVIWNGITTRFLPHNFRVASDTASRGMPRFLENGTLLQDFGITYDEIETAYDRFEKTCGTSGKAGNLRGRIVQGGNVFEGARSDEYPNPPLPDSQAGALFRTAAAGLGYHPYPVPASNSSRLYAIRFI